MTTGHLYRVNKPGHRRHGSRVMDVTNERTKPTPGVRRVRGLIDTDDGSGRYDLGEAWACVEEWLEPLPMRYYRGATPETRRWLQKVNKVDIA